MRWLAAWLVPSGDAVTPPVSVASPPAWAMASKTLAVLLRLAFVPGWSCRFLPSFQPSPKLGILFGESQTFVAAAGQLRGYGQPLHRFAAQVPRTERRFEQRSQSHFERQVSFAGVAEHEHNPPPWASSFASGLAGSSITFGPAPRERIELRGCIGTARHRRESGK